MSNAEHERGRGDEHEVTPLELFFDLVFVFAITQVTSLLVHHPTWGGVLRRMLVLAAVWWAWTTYGWLTSATDVDEAGVRLSVLAATTATLCGGAALYLLAQIAFLRRAIGRIFRRRTAGALVLIALIPIALVVPSLVALALVASVCSLVVAYEAIGRREYRARLRHPDLAA